MKFINDIIYENNHPKLINLCYHKLKINLIYLAMARLIQIYLIESNQR